MYTVLIMTDSRGAGLEHRIRKALNQNHQELSAKIQVTVRAMGGTTTKNIINRMDERFKNVQNYDMIFTFVGVNDITRKMPNGLVEPVFNNVPELVEYLTDSYTKIENRLKGSITTNSNIPNSGD